MERRSRFSNIVEYDSIAPYLGAAVGEGGHSQIFSISNRQGWLAKLYRSESPGPQESERLDRLVQLRHRLTGKDFDLSSRAMSWPVARITAKNATVGVLVPAAPDKFCAEFTTVSDRRVTQLLEIDWLAVSDKIRTRRGLTNPKWEERLAVCRDISAVAEFFERRGLVYGDWNYRNVFWSIHDHSAYVIDIDSCSFGRQPLLATPNWEDPLSRKFADIYTDRYLVALLVARCLTGERESTRLVEAVRDISSRANAPRLKKTLVAALNADRRDSRPAAAELSEAIHEALIVPERYEVPAPTATRTTSIEIQNSPLNYGSANVFGWKPSLANRQGRNEIGDKGMQEE